MWSKKKRWFPSLWLCTLLVAPMPVALTVPEDRVLADEDAATTSVKFGAGGGSYRRDIIFSFTSPDGCTSSEPLYLNQGFVDVGLEIEHADPGAFRLGVRGGVIRENYEVANTFTSGVNVDSLERQADPIDQYYYVNPYIAGDWTWFGVGIGAIFSSEPLRTGDTDYYPEDEGTKAFASGHLRLGSESPMGTGNLQGIYGLISVGENVPIYSGGGLFNMGLGLRPITALDVWAGKAFGPWTDSEWLVKVGVHPSPEWSIDGTLRFPSSSASPGSNDVTEYGIGLGITYRIRHE